VRAFFAMDQTLSTIVFGAAEYDLVFMQGATIVAASRSRRDDEVSMLKIPARTIYFFLLSRAEKIRCLPAGFCCVQLQG
jgi:hypothetical protein